LCPTLSPCPAKRFDQSGPKPIAFVSLYKRRYPENFITIGYLLKFSHAIAKTHLLDYLINEFTNRLENWYDAMPHATEHASKVST